MGNKWIEDPCLLTLAKKVDHWRNVLSWNHGWIQTMDFSAASITYNCFVPLVLQETNGERRWRESSNGKMQSLSTICDQEETFFCKPTQCHQVLLVWLKHIRFSTLILFQYLIREHEGQINVFKSWWGRKYEVEVHLSTCLDRIPSFMNK